MASRLLTRYDGVSYVKRKFSPIHEPVKRERKFRLRVYFPEMPVVVMPKGNLVTQRGRLMIKVPRNYTKPEIKQYLSKIYGLGILKVNTMNYVGKVKHKYKQVNKKHWRRIAYKTAGFKKAIVTVDNTMFLDLLAEMNLNPALSEADAVNAAANQ